MKIYFDDALPIFASIIAKSWGDEALKNNIFLREPTGKLTFIVNNNSFDEEKRRSLSQVVRKNLIPYVEDDDFCVSTPNDLFDDRLGDTRNANKISLDHKVFKGSVWIIDRRIVGADWLRSPSASGQGPVRIVFASIKGGVGRSTALCVLASHLASIGRRVLTIDMDLEAPGLGSMLLSEDTLPDFGLLDYFVERNLSGISDEFILDLISPSWLGKGKGRIDVIPALGRRSLKNPENVLAKIARAYLSDNSTSSNLEPATFTDHFNELIANIDSRGSYDVVLIDARAGLHETSAAAIIGLGAQVLFFGINQEQTFSGYRLLLSHLSTLKVNSDDDWRERITFVQAKASLEDYKNRYFEERIQNLLEEYFWPNNRVQEKTPDLVSLQNEFEVDWSEKNIDLDEREIQFSPLLILDDQRYHGFDPLRDKNALEEKFYFETFSDFLLNVTEFVD
ncbi:ParA family protein [Rugamonas sp. A1-17]|nr:ParA family protein [Rugamonas sp. A1-17]